MRLWLGDYANLPGRSIHPVRALLGIYPSVLKGSALLLSCLVFLGAADVSAEMPRGPIGGMTIGPIENALHPGRGYGSQAYGQTLAECMEWGANWIALTPFGRVGDMRGEGVDPTFEAPFETNRADVKRAIEQAHARGLKVFLVPHIWVEWTKPGDWRALIDPKTDEGWARYAASYGRFLHAWAEVAEETHVELFAAGVEMRSWVTTKRAPLFSRLVADVRRVYHGPITLSANWDDAEDTVVWGDLDVIGINAFYPLTDRTNATFKELLAGAEKVRNKVQTLHTTWRKPVLFTEIGYTTRRDPALHPWEWPDAMKGVVVDDVAERAQADATAALLAPLFETPGWLGFFVWRVYADPNDVSQEPPFGFSPRGKRAERVLRDAFSAMDRNRTRRFLPSARCTACGRD